MSEEITSGTNPAHALSQQPLQLNRQPVESMDNRIVFDNTSPNKMIGTQSVRSILEFAFNSMNITPALKSGTNEHAKYDQCCKSLAQRLGASEPYHKQIELNEIKREIFVSNLSMILPQGFGLSGAFIEQAASYILSKFNRNDPDRHNIAGAERTNFNDNTRNIRYTSGGEGYGGGGGGNTSGGGSDFMNTVMLPIKSIKNLWPGHQSGNDRAPEHPRPELTEMTRLIIRKAGDNLEIIPSYISMGCVNTTNKGYIRNTYSTNYNMEYKQQKFILSKFDIDQIGKKITIKHTEDTQDDIE